MAKKDRRNGLWQAGNTLCPICLMEFSEEDIASRLAEVEHTPPLKAGKPHLTVLTCQKCNRKGGEWIDKAAIEALKQEYDGTLTTQHGTISVKMGLGHSGSIERGLITINHPSVDGSLYLRPTRKQELPRLPTAELKLAWVQRKQRSIAIGLLKAAYLAVFAIVGVEFAKAKALRRVRAQIRQPDELILENFCIPCRKHTGRRICLVYRSGSKTCWGVMLDGFMVLIPSMDDEEWKSTGDIQEISTIKQFTQTFGASKNVLFPAVAEIPVTALPARGIEEVGSLGWELRAKAMETVRHFVSIGRRGEKLWLLEVRQGPS